MVFLGRYQPLKWLDFFADAGIPPSAAAQYSVAFADERIPLDKARIDFIYLRKKLDRKNEVFRIKIFQGSICVPHFQNSIFAIFFGLVVHTHFYPHPT